MPPCLKFSNLKYDGTRDPAKHLETYKSWMELNFVSNDFQCQAFFITLTSIAQYWFRTLRSQFLPIIQGLYFPVQCQ